MLHVIKSNPMLHVIKSNHAPCSFSGAYGKGGEHASSMLRCVSHMGIKAGVETREELYHKTLGSRITRSILSVTHTND
jgi:hypothetical protein